MLASHGSFRLSRCLNLALNLPEDSVDYFAKPTSLPPLLDISNPSLFHLVICDFFHTLRYPGLQVWSPFTDASSWAGTKTTFFHIIHPDLVFGGKKPSSFAVTDSNSLPPPPNSLWPLLNSHALDISDIILIPKSTKHILSSLSGFLTSSLLPWG